MSRRKSLIARAAGAVRGAPRNVRIAVAGLTAVVALAAIGSVAAQQIRSPAQLAADAAPPAASPISVPVERRALATEVIVRGTVRYGAPQEVVLPLSPLKAATSVVSRVPKAGARLDEGDTAIVVSGRPVFVLRGADPMHRDLGPGSEGADVRQLEQALARSGLRPGSVDGRYDGATAAAVAALYVKRNETPFGATDAQAAELRTAAATAAAARDAVLQTRLALRSAERGTAPADISQARLDLAAADEAILPARLAIAAATDHAAGAQAAIDTAKLAETTTNSSAGREIAAADADVTTRRAAVSAALDAQAEAQRNLAAAALPPDTPPGDYESLRAAVRRTTDAVGVARADVTAAERGAEAARSGVPLAVDKARMEGRRAEKDLSLAHSELDNARSLLKIAERKRGLSRARLRILRTAPSASLERQIVAAARSEAGRTQAELTRLALRTGVQVPADEILFFATLPVRVDTLSSKRGSQVQGSVMTVTNSRLAIDSSLSIGDAKLVRRGMLVKIEEQDLQVSTQGTVAGVADKPGTLPAGLAGTTPPDPARTYIEILPRSAPPSLVGASVKLSIAVQSTKGKVLAVPIGALSVAADGTSRVQIDRGGGRSRFVTVVPGLAAQGFVEVRQTGKDALRERDLVVIGSGAAAATKAPTGAGSDPGSATAGAPGAP